MAAPTLISSIQIDSPWLQTNNLLTSALTKAYPGTLATSSGDLIVVLQGAANANDAFEITASDGVNTYTQRTNIETANHCSVNIATAPDSSGGTRTITLTRETSNGNTSTCVGGIAFQFRNHGGVGNVFTAADGIQTGNLTCSANSAICVICLDWNATTGTRTWATINGNSPTLTFGVNGDAASWAVAGAYWADVGSAGSKTITLSSPTYGVATFAAIEILAGAGGSSIGPGSRISLLGVG